MIIWRCYEIWRLAKSSKGTVEPPESAALFASAKLLGRML